MSCIFLLAVHFLHGFVGSGKRTWLTTMFLMSISYFASSMANLSVSYILKNSGMHTATKVVLVSSLNYLLISSIFFFIPSMLSKSFLCIISGVICSPLGPGYIMPPIELSIPPNFSFNSINLTIPFSKIFGKLSNLSV